MAELQQSLRERFVDGQNRIQWDELAGGLAGILLYRIMEGLLSIVVAVKEGIVTFGDTVTAAIASGFGAIGDTLVAELSASWDPVDLGILTYPVAVGIVLIAFWLSARVISRG